MTRAHWAVLAVTALTTTVLTPVVRWAAVRRGALVQPDDRRVHETPTAALGGVAMWVAVLVGLGLASVLDGFNEVFVTPTIPIGIAAAATVATVVGWLDEVRKIHGNGVSAPAKMAGLVLAGGVLTLAGVSTVFFRVPFLGIFSLSPDLSAFVTMCWVVGMANALNFIDGLDGLAAGITAIASGAFLLYAIRLDDVGVVAPGNIGVLIAIITLGVCVGFLPWNVHPAKIFMGDCGALLLGVLMAAATMSVGGSTDATYSGQSFFFLAPLFIPLVILGVPILDTAFAIVRRATSRAGVATADKGHLHHRLLKLGHGHFRAVLILWLWTALLSAAVLVPALTHRGDALVPLAIGGLFLILYTVLHPSVRAARSEANGEGAAETTESEPVPHRHAHERTEQNERTVGVAGHSDS
jgi:UDP-GlcNAc:undecaprenyl-phosphate GlcNAc-1-phosphate transferase